MKQLDPRAVWLFFINALPLSLVVVVIAVWLLGASALFGLVSGTSFGTISVGVLAVSLLVAYVWARMTYRFWRYELTNEGLRQESGILIKSSTVLPYARIQNADIYRNIKARLLGLSYLSIQTAGTNTTEAYLPGLSREEAEQLRTALMQRAKQGSSI